MKDTELSDARAGKIMVSGNLLS